MFEIDVTAWLGKMGEQRCPVAKLARKVGVSRNTMAHYMAHPEKTPYPIIQAVTKALNLSYSEAQAIFFKEKLA